MRKQASILNNAWAHLRQSFAHLTTGGDFALSLSGEARHNLHWFFFDGLYASASDNIIGTYFILYFLILGATNAQIGFMSSLSSLSAAFLLLPGALLVERLGRRKQIVLLGGGTISRLVIILWVLVPLTGLKGPALIYLVMGLTVTRDAFANLSYPAWISLLADIVPLEGRGRYFGSRNFVMGVAGMVTVVLIGELITRAGKPLGYQLALGLAFLLGAISTYSYSRIRDPHGIHPPEVGAPLVLKDVISHLKAHPGFLAMSGVAVLWNFSLNVAGPFFTPYLVQNLKATATMVGITSVASTISSLTLQRKMGELCDRWGPHRMMLISGLLIPIVPFSWIFARAAWHVIPINIMSGALCGAYNLAAFNFLLDLTPREQRARYSAIYQVVVTIALAIGAAVGGLIVTLWGYVAIFLCSSLGRLLAAILFARFVHVPSPIPSKE
jgi:MFS family permease